MKSMTKETVEILAEEAVRRKAEEENIEMGVALRNISEEELKRILRGDRPAKRSGRLFRERLLWGLSVAALLAVAIALPLGVERKAGEKIDDLVYAYNVPSRGLSKGGEEVLDIETLSDAGLEESMDKLEEAYQKASTAQETAITGKTLALAYIRLHNRDEARRVLESMIDRLQGDEDYLPIVGECRRILKEIE